MEIHVWKLQKKQSGLKEWAILINQGDDWQRVQTGELLFTLAEGSNTVPALMTCQQKTCGVVTGGRPQGSALHIYYHPKRKTDDSPKDIQGTQERKESNDLQRQK